MSHRHCWLPGWLRANPLPYFLVALVALSGVAHSNTITVTGTADTLANGDGQVTLREAIQAANTNTSVDGSTAGSGADTIDFAAGVAPTITLTSALPALSEDITITGSGANVLTVQEGGTSHLLNIFTVNSGVFATISGLTISNGSIGIRNSSGTLGVINCAINDNNLFGIDNGGIARADNSTLNGNHGYGIQNAQANNLLTAINCTITGSNGNPGAGAGVFHGFGSTVNLTHCTIVGNKFGTDGSGTMNLRDSICAANTNNNITPFGTNNLLGDNYVGAAPLLGALANNGGPTLTMMPQTGSPASPAIDAALSSTFTIDQRGFPRPVDGDGDSSALPDLGAVEALSSAVITLSINDVTVTEGNTGTTDATFTVCLSQVSTQDVTVDYATDPGTATAGGAGGPGDYNSATGTVTIPAGQLCTTITITVNGDTLVECDETYFVNLSGATNATILDGQGLGTIVNDDVPTLSIGDVTVTEGNTGTTTSMIFSVCLSQVSCQNVTVNYQTGGQNALSPDDFTDTFGTLTIPAGQLCGTITVPIIGDTLVECNETMVVNLNPGPTNATILDGQGIGTITDNDFPSLSINNVTVVEGNTGGTNSAVFDVCLSQVSCQNVTVNYITAPGSATANTDYSTTSLSDSDGGTPGTLTIPAGQLCGTITVPIIGETLYELNENFVVSLTAPTNATIFDGLGLGTINNDDAKPTISIDDVVVTEGTGGTNTATFNVCLSVISGVNSTVNYATGNGSAVAPSDYTTTTGTVTIPAGQLCVTITVPIVTDALFELNETFFVNLSVPISVTILDAQGIGTITNDDNAPPTLSISDVIVTEGTGGTNTATFNVCLSAISSQPVTVNYATGNGSAVAPGDYTTTTGTVTIPASTLCVTITVPIVTDTLVECNETFFVNLSGATNATILDGQGLGTITNDDVPTLTISDATVTEGNTNSLPAAFQICLSQVSCQPVTVTYATSNGNAVAPGDYTSTAGTVTIPAGTLCVTINVPVIGETLMECDEAFRVNLSGPTNATILDGVGVGTIINNDFPSLSINNVTVIEGNTGGTNSAVFDVCLSQVSCQNVTVNYITAPGSATSGTDYSTTLSDSDGGTPGVLTIPAGQLCGTITVPIIGETLYELNENFVVSLTAPTNATIFDGLGLGTINNDDAKPTLSISDKTVTEGTGGTNTATFSICLSAFSGVNTTVNYATFPGSATSGTDYSTTLSDSDGGTPGVLTIPAGTLCGTITVPIVTDTLYEANETFFVNLSVPINATIFDGVGLGTINNDDAKPTVSINDVIVTEGTGGANTAMFSVCLSAISGLPVTVTYNTVNGSAVAPGDYGAVVSGTLTIPAGQLCGTINISIVTDAVPETHQVFTVNLSNPTNATIVNFAAGQGFCTIKNDDAKFFISDVQMMESENGTRLMYFSVALSHPVWPATSVKYETQITGTGVGHAIPNNDYANIGQTLLPFASGVTTSLVTMVIFGDTNIEPNETFKVHLSAPTGGAGITIFKQDGIGTIVNDD